LLVSGRISPPASGSTARAASMVLYVVDVRGGQFAALSVPWDRSMRNAAATQASLFVPVGGDMIRPPLAQGVGPRKPPAGNAANPNERSPTIRQRNNCDQVTMRRATMRILPRITRIQTRRTLRVVR
jgi:hypothetical protein